MDLKTAVGRVADRTVARDMESEDWARAVALDGLRAVGSHEAAVRRSVDRAVATQTSEGQFAYGWGEYPREWAKWTDYDVESYSPTANPAAMGRSVLAVHERTGSERYLKAARRQYEFFEDTERTADGGISRRGDRVELFTEILYFLVPFFLRYGAVVDETSPVEAAVEQADVHCKHLQDPHTGLFRHIWRETPNSYPEGSFWSRGNGWAVAGLLDAILLLPDDHPARDRLRSSLRDALDAVVELQDASGFWHQCLDDPTTPLETSGTAIFAYTLRRGIDAGAVPEDHASTARDAMDACLGVVDEEGRVRRVSKPPASSLSPLGVTSYGQGWFLRAAAQFL
jgi:unsaturated rhamnogalacturonyl hydrolase